MKKLEFLKMNQKMAVSFEFPIPPWYKKLFYETCLMYFHSCSQENRIPHAGLSIEIQDILKGFFIHQKSSVSFFKTKETKTELAPDYSFDESKIAVAFSGGKDCVYLVHKLIESGYKPENILNLYIPSLNKSESYYEKIAVEKISKKFGCQFHIIPTVNSIKLNRTGHNIGVREQLIAGLCLPYMIQFGASKIYFGLKKEVSNSHLYSDDPKVFKLYQDRINKDVPQIELVPYSLLKGTTDLDIAKVMAREMRDILDITSSCYTQLNFREKRHETLKQRFKEIPIYNGCGSCQKCMIINAAIVLEMVEVIKDSTKKRFLNFYEKRMEEKFMDNTDITTAHKEMKSLWKM